MPMKRTGNKINSTTKPYAGAAASNCTPTKRGYRNRERSSIGALLRRSIQTNATPLSSATHICHRAQPASGDASTAQVNIPNANVKATAPGTSKPLACGLRDSSTLRTANTNETKATGTTQSTTPCQPVQANNHPAINGPNASPTPNEVPTRLNTRARCGPS